MHDGLQLETLVLVLFGILLNRYDFDALRKDMREEIAGLRKQMGSQANLSRANVNRRMTALNSTLFYHHERLAVIETKMEEKK